MSERFPHQLAFGSIFCLRNFLNIGVHLWRQGDVQDARFSLGWITHTNSCNTL
jgi:hypothetical protein